uniref:Methyltransferase FkbM domain-containing protein n=1 Tax=viral metagenome TaxID=1070528 RepID=A0A6C0KTR5_9ZZZZ
MYFDIGSNIGKWALANIDQCDKIVSVEASPYTYQRLVNNCKHDRIVLLNYAVCNNDGKDITFYHADADVLSTINKEWLTSESSRFHNYTFTEIVCKTITIDQLIAEHGKPEMIKIDVEGGEYECITSLTQKVDVLCFEWASEVNDITFKCLDYLATLGFTEFYVQFGDEYAYRPTAYGTMDSAKEQLSNSVPKEHWGMLWCR